MIFLIQKMWTDYMENVFCHAFGYQTIGYVMDEEEAKKIVAAAGKTDPIDGAWPLDFVDGGRPVPNMRYEPVIPYNPTITFLPDMRGA